MKKMSKIILVAVFIGMLTMILSVNAFGVNTVYYTDSDGNVYGYAYTGDSDIRILSFTPSKPLANVVIPADICDGSIEIERSAFSGSNIKSVYIPENAIVEDGAFANCKKLETVEMYGQIAGRYTFENCSKLKSVTLGDNVTTLSNYTFGKCTSLEHIDLNKVEKVELEAFSECESLISVKGESLKTIGYGGFRDCEKLSSINFPVLEEIGNCAFSGCSSLESIDLFTVKELGQYVFKDCTALKECTNYNLTSVSDGLFYGCTSLEFFHQYSKIETIGSYSFNDCKSLPALNLKNISSIGSYAFKGCDKITEVTLRSETSYGYASFGCCENLKEIVVEDKLSTVRVNDNKASFINIFEGCENVETIYIGSKFNGKSYYPTSKTTREDYADISLHEFKNLKSVEIASDNLHFFMIDDVVYFENASTLMLLCYMNDKVGEEFITPDTDKDFVISPYTFSDTKYLKKVVFLKTPTISDSVKIYYGRTEYKMGEYAFKNSSVEEVVTPNGAFKTIPMGMFQDSRIKTIDLSEITFADRYIFKNCDNLTSINMPLLTYIDYESFMDCDNLDSVRMPRIYSINSRAFMNCLSLKHINLSGVNSVCGDAFANCVNLEVVEFSENLKNISTPFTNCPNLTFYCDKDTFAYEYAKKNNIPVIVFTVAFQNDVHFEYTGKEICPSIIVAFGNMALVENQDYVLIYSDNIAVGQALVKVRFIGNFEGFEDTERMFLIETRKVDNLTVEYVVDNEYSGEAVRPKVVVKNGKIVLVEGVDYTITYNNSANIGSMFFTITGIGNYTGSVDCYYNIIRCDIAETTVSKNNDMLYTGEEITPKPVITWNGFTLQENVDYEIRYFENVNSGYGTMVIYGMGNFCGTQRIQFRIFGKGIENAVITEIPDQIYNGNEITPSFTVTIDGVTLIKDIDYTVQYENNIEKGKATVVISGIGNYSGVMKQFFNINKNSVYSFIVFSETEMTVTYDGTELKPEMEVYFGTQLLTEGVDYTVSLQNNVNVGVATVTIIGIGLYEGERSYNFTIIPCEITENDISVSGNMEYCGSAVKPEISVFKNGATLVEGEDYTVTYSNNNAVGIAFVTIKGMGNYCDTINLEYEIYAPKVPEDEDKEDNNGEENNDTPIVTPETPEKPEDKEDVQENENTQNNVNDNKNENADIENEKEENKDKTDVQNPVIPNTDYAYEAINILGIVLLITYQFAFAIIGSRKKKKV